MYSGKLWTRVSSVGSTGERPFVLVCGIGVSSHYFEQLAPHLEQYGPVYALDLPGFGGVPHNRSGLSMTEYADLLGDVIDSLDAPDPVIVGHSMGTQVVADLASRRPGLSTIVLISPVVDSERRKLATQAWRFATSSWREPFRVKVLAVTAYLFCGFNWFFRVLPNMLTYRIEDTAERIRADTLLIRGQHDAVCPPEWIATLSSRLPTSSAFEVEGAAHSVMHAHAREVARLCVDHADRGSAAHDDDAVTRVAELPDEGVEVAPLQAVDILSEELKGVATEVAGSAKGSDDLVEEGRNRQADARRALRGD
ncbi:alpha/beta fold hydrolase [Arthrobacter sp. CAN_A1]|uniref:alpha/beta fold hydrolase n=1 Tax=Arthrobacter sp. CAN_A1 TaxID=2787717 RepID=UPI0018C9A951